ncbi:unnamed protein product [Rhodiola kirilowii]
MGRPPCCDKLGVKKGPWTPEEDIILVSYIQEHGPGNWRSVPTNTGLLRCSKSCRLRWTNYLRPGIRRGSFTDQEEKMIIHLQALLGNRWAAISSYLPQRTDNDIKNYWNTHLKKKLKKLQLGSDNNSQDNNSSSSSASHQTTSKGQWERRLQTDIHMAKQALYEALSLDKPIYETKQPTQQPSSNPNNILLTPTPTNKVTTMGMSQPSSMSSANTTYASSAENIAKLLENWSKKKSSSGSVSQMTPITTMNSGGSVNGIYPLKIKEQHHVKEESKPLSMEGQAPQGPLTLLEKWLLFDDGSNAIAGQGQDALLDMSSLDGNAVFF